MIAYYKHQHRLRSDWHASSRPIKMHGTPLARCTSFTFPSYTHRHTRTGNRTHTHTHTRIEMEKLPSIFSWRGFWFGLADFPRAWWIDSHCWRFIWAQFLNKHNQINHFSWIFIMAAALRRFISFFIVGVGMKKKRIKISLSLQLVSWEWPLSYAFWLRTIEELLWREEEREYFHIFPKNKQKKSFFFVHFVSSFDLQTNLNHNLSDGWINLLLNFSLN